MKDNCIRCGNPANSSHTFRVFDEVQRPITKLPICTLCELELMDFFTPHAHTHNNQKPAKRIGFVQ